MDGFKSWMFSVCVAVVIVTIFSMFTPNGKMEKIMRFTISMFFILIISAPIIGFIKDYKNFEPDNLINNSSQASNTDYKENVKDVFIKKVELALKKGLERKQINISDLSVDINITEDNCIEINKVEIFIHKLSKKQESEINKYIKEEAKVSPKIIRYK